MFDFCSLFWHSVLTFFCTFIMLCPFFGIASTFSFVLLYTWIHNVWSPSHLSTPSCVSSCVAFIEDVMLLQLCMCVCTCLKTEFFRFKSTAAWKTHFRDRSHTSNHPQHFSLQCCSSPQSNRYCITYIINVIVRNNGNSKHKKNKCITPQGKTLLVALIYPCGGFLLLSPIREHPGPGPVGAILLPWDWGGAGIGVEVGGWLRSVCGCVFSWYRGGEHCSNLRK